jgi:hypothetical protein
MLYPQYYLWQDANKSTHRCTSEYTFHLKEEKKIENICNSLNSNL